MSNHHLVPAVLDVMAVGKLKYIVAAGLVIVLSVMAFFHEREVARESFMMDTIVNIRAFHRSEDIALDAINQTLQQMQQTSDTLNRYLDPSISEIALINLQAGPDPVEVSTDTLTVLRQSQEVARMTNGAFNPAIGALTNLWETIAERQSLPTEEEIRWALERVDFNDLALDLDASTAFLEKPGVSLDLGGSAKGFVVDVAARSLQQLGIERAFIDAGGDIRVLGRRDQRNLWRIGIADPTAPSQVMGIVSIENASIVTSGTYQRFVTIEGQQFHHVLSPYTGYPTAGVLSATVIAPTALLGDALSTALMVLGPQEGIDLINTQYPEAEALIITENRTLYLSEGMLALFQLSGTGEWTFAE